MRPLIDVALDQSVNIWTATLRILLSLVAGGLIGLERASRRQPAGLRTHILISVGATLLMLLSIYIPQQFYDMKNGDPGRIAAQVVSGIGFLGAGAILKLGNNIKGLTTAASIWVAAAVGLAIGAGLFYASFIATGVVLFALMLLDPVERRFFPPERIKVVNLYFKGSSVDTKGIRRIFGAHGVKIQSVDVVQELEKELVQVNVLARIPVSIRVPHLYKDLRELSSIYKIKMDERI